MEAIAAVAGQLATVNVNSDVHGTLADVRFLVKGLNLLLITVMVLVVFLSISAVLLDWAYFYHGAGVHYVGDTGSGNGGGGSQIVHVHRGDGMGITILKAVIGSVLGFVTVNFLKGTATPQYISTLGRAAQVEPTQVTNTYRAALAYLSARRSVVCYTAAMVLAVVTGFLFWRRYLILSIVCGIVTVVFCWSGFMYGRESQHEVAIVTSSTPVDEVHSGDEKVHIVVTGIVGSGKTSLLKAFLKIDRDENSERNRMLNVGFSISHKEAVDIVIDDSLVIHDLPGDLALAGYAQRPHGQYDVGIFVAKGSADEAQKNLYDRLKSQVREVFVVRSMSDMDLDRLRPDARERLLDQWREALNVDRIYVTSVFGYDEDVRPDTPLRITGVDALRDDVMTYLSGNGRGIVLMRHMQQKDKSATSIIIKAVTRVILGDNLRAVEVRAAEQLHYLYTGRWEITVRPPEIHPALTLTTRLVSLIPYLGRLTDSVAAASTLALQLVAMSRALKHQLTVASPVPQEMQQYANEVARSLDSGWFQKICEQIVQHGPSVYAAGEEVLFEGLAGMVAGDMMMRQ